MALCGGGDGALLRLHHHLAPGSKLRTGGSLIRTGLTVRAGDARRQRRPENVDGEFFVDRTCIDCDTCRWMAPSTFASLPSGHGQSVVHQQPRTKAERVQALQALLACPTASIHTQSPPPDILEVHDTFPIPVDERGLPGVYHCGYHSPKLFAAASYFVVRDAPGGGGGNVLVDSPRFTERLARRLELLGGVRYMFLTHKDDVADHKPWRQRLGCDRILHADDVTRDTDGVEVKLQGHGAWSIIGDDVQLVYNPGHTEGSVSMFVEEKRALFTGDHLGGRPDGEVDIFREVNWFSVEEQLRSVREATMPLDFVWLLPGHGRRVKFDSLEHKNRAISQLLSR